VTGGKVTDATAEFFGALAERGHVPLLERAKGTVRFELAHGKRVDRWLLVVDKGDLAVSRRNARAECTFRADKALFDRIADGKVNATAAVLRGAVVIDGNMELLVQLQKLFPGPPAKRGRRRNGASGRRRT
jgi:putative sterol carrier protein